MKENLNKKWLVLEEAAEYLRCTAEELREEANKKKVPYSMFKRRRLFNIDRLDEWLSSQEMVPSASSSTRATISQEDIKILPSCDRKEVESLIHELIEYNGGNEIFVNSFGRQLKDNLKENGYKKLSKKTFERLSRWCHPRKSSPRNNEVQEIARKISMQLYGKVIDRKDN